MAQVFRPLDPWRVKLGPSMFQKRFELNRRYLLSLRRENLLQSHYLEAGLWSNLGKPADAHWGWESPTSLGRGEFLGHWLSAAARIYAETGDAELKARADWIVSELGRCQAANGGEWVGSLPEKALGWASRGLPLAVPYTLHKTLLGLYEMAAYAKNEQALEIIIRWARWFERWTAQYSPDQMADRLDWEQGGMMETWANLYGLTQRPEHLELMQRYARHRLFDPLLEGMDVLSNQHANTTIPEVHGAARAWEVTGQDIWREIAEAYWKSAVSDRGYFCTGGQTCGEMWIPPGRLSVRLGHNNQEHCTVYNMMRLAEYLLRWTGDPLYADYWERNLYNGLLAQQHPDSGMVAYFLPLRAGSLKKWGTATEDFWCCHGTLVQAQTLYGYNIFFEDHEGLVVSQVIPSVLTWEWKGVAVKVSLSIDKQIHAPGVPEGLVYDLRIECPQPVDFGLKVRIPWWVGGQPTIEVEGQRQTDVTAPSTYVTLRRIWSHETVRVVLPKQIRTEPLPGGTDLVAFMDGPVVLAGLCAEERTLYGDPSCAETMVEGDAAFELWRWLPGYKTIGQPTNFQLIPLYHVRDERYTVYFPVQNDQPQR
jgi:DUF1680 family protein